MARPQRGGQYRTQIQHVCFILTVIVRKCFEAVPFLLLGPWDPCSLPLFFLPLLPRLLGLLIPCLLSLGHCRPVSGPFRLSLGLRELTSPNS